MNTVYIAPVSYTHLPIHLHGSIYSLKQGFPINAMGISKAMMEKVAIAKGRALGEGAGTTICCTRYGLSLIHISR